MTRQMLHSLRIVGALGLVGLMVLIGASIFKISPVNDIRSDIQPAAAPATPTLPRKPNETGVPTPFPTVSPSQMPLPVGTRVEKPTPPPYTPFPTKKPSDPYNVRGISYRVPNTRFSTKEATAIIIGTVKQVGPARWSTVNGARPPNPHAPDNKEFIFRPVLIDVEQYLKGQPPQKQLLVAADGGVVGQDSFFEMGDDIFTFSEGERVIVFLVGRGRSLNANALWEIVERYTITLEGNAVNSRRQVPFKQLLTEITTALNP